jgi:hypothetical protein
MIDASFRLSADLEAFAAQLGERYSQIVLFDVQSVRALSKTVNSSANSLGAPNVEFGEYDSTGQWQATSMSGRLREHHDNIWRVIMFDGGLCLWAAYHLWSAVVGSWNW